jgi:hypothetical protein
MTDNTKPTTDAAADAGADDDAAAFAFAEKTLEQLIIDNAAARKAAVALLWEQIKEEQLKTTVTKPVNGALDTIPVFRSAASRRRTDTSDTE